MLKKRLAVFIAALAVAASFLGGAAYAAPGGHFHMADPCGFSDGE